MPINLLERARQNRIHALESLTQKEENIFLLDDARADRKRRNNIAVFVSRRIPTTSTYEQNEKIAA